MLAGLLGLTSQSIGYLCISVSLPRLPAVITSIILLVQPVISVGLGIVLLDERPSLAQLLGVVLVIGGIAIATVPVARCATACRHDGARHPPSRLRRPVAGSSAWPSAPT